MDLTINSARQGAFTINTTKMTQRQTARSRVEQAEKDGVFPKVNRLISGAFLLTTLAQMLYDDAGEKMKMYGLLLGQDKQNFNRVIAAFSNYTGQFVHNLMEGKERDKVNAYFAEDFDRYLPKVLKMLELEDDYN